MQALFPLLAFTLLFLVSSIANQASPFHLLLSDSDHQLKKTHQTITNSCNFLHIQIPYNLDFHCSKVGFFFTSLSGYFSSLLNILTPSLCQNSASTPLFCKVVPGVYYSRLRKASLALTVYWRQRFYLLLSLFLYCCPIFEKNCFIVGENKRVNTPK